jgi:hypothetical protein
VLLVHTAGLGEFGGHPGSPPIARASRGLAVGPLDTLLLLMPQPVVRDPRLAEGLVAAAAAALASGLALLPAFLLLVGALARGAGGCAAEHHGMPAALGTLPTLLLLAQALRFSPFLHAYPEWPPVSRRSRELP